MTSNEHYVYNALATEGEALSVPEIAEQIGLSVAKVRTAVGSLVEQGKVEPLGFTSSNARCYGIKAS